jgi:hypothetical protein
VLSDNNNVPLLYYAFLEKTSFLYRFRQIPVVWWRPASQTEACLVKGGVLELIEVIAGSVAGSNYMQSVTQLPAVKVNSGNSFPTRRRHRFRPGRIYKRICILAQIAILRTVTFFARFFFQTSVFKMFFIFCPVGELFLCLQVEKP